MVDQERLGLPSASSALYDSLCYGRHHAQLAWDNVCSANEPAEDEFDDSVPEIDRDIEAGKRIHLLYAGNEIPGAKPAETDRVARAKQIDRTMFEKWMANLGYEPLAPLKTLRETRWWYYDEQ